MTNVPIIDLSRFNEGDATGRRDVVETLRRALVDTGFFLLTGHRVPVDLIADFENASLDFFDLPEAEKERYIAPVITSNRGYGALRSRTIGKTEDQSLLPSLQEGFGVGQVDVPPDDPFYKAPEAANIFAENIWPERPLAFKPLAIRYYREMSRVFREVMGLFAVALDLPEDYFSPLLTKHGSSLRLVHYPALDRPPAPGEVRAGAHTDTGTMTILHIDDTPSALQVKTRAGDWIDINKVPGAYVINIGDILMRWTNDVWKSNLHRVVNPPLVNGKSNRRLSIVFFCQTNYNTLVECLPGCSSPENPPKYPPVISSRYSARRAAERYGLTGVAS